MPTDDDFFDADVNEDDDTVDMDPYHPADGADVIAQAVTDQLAAFAAQTGRALRADIKAVGAYAAERAAHLATLSGQPGFEDAVLAERDNVVLRAGIAATQRGDNIDQRLIGIIQGALRTAAVVLAA